MNQQVLPQTALDLLNELDADGLAALIKKLEGDVKEDDERLVAMKNRLEELKQLKEALQKEDSTRIQTIREKLGLPPTTS